MVITRTMVATDALLQKTHGEARHSAAGVPGIKSAEFTFDVSECKTVFGRWLAENILTTRRDDDLSILWVKLRQTEADISLADITEKMRRNSVRSPSDLEAVIKLFNAWSQGQKQFVEVYGEAMFQQRSIAFEWPVLGSRAAENIESPAAYFDLCAARIRAFKPVSVRTGGGEEPPASFGVTAR